MITLLGKVVMMSQRRDHQLKRKTRSIRSIYQKVTVIADNPGFMLLFLANQVADQTAFFLLKMFAALFQLVGNQWWHQGYRHQLGMGVGNGGGSSHAVIFKNKNIAEATVLTQIKHAGTVGSEHFSDLRFT